MAEDEAGTVEIPKGWRMEDGGTKMVVDVELKDFRAAVALVNTVAEIAEDLDHHPDLHLTDYKHLRIESTSHDVGRLTERDEALATRIDEVLVDQGLI